MKITRSERQVSTKTKSYPTGAACILTKAVPLQKKKRAVPPSSYK